MPASVPSSPADLEQLPALVQDFLGNIPPEQLPEAISAQMQSMQPEELQQMIAALFPGANPQELPQIVAASFPGLSQQELQGMFSMAFPGQNIQIPETGSLGGKIVLGIYDQGRNQYDVYLAPIMGKPQLVMENASDPSLSPDGQYIVYHSSAPDKGGLRIMKVDGSEDAQLTSIASDRNPRFSPDGTRILYSNIDNNTLHVINRDGSGRRDLGSGKYPDWSPDGKEIVYQGCVSGGRCGLIRANADGSNARQITTNANDTMPRWKYGNIAFLSDRDGNFEIYVISDNGTWLRRITIDPATDIMPVWNPGGVQIAFRSDRKGDPAIYITSGIGGGDFKQFSAAFGSDWMLAGMDWGN
jgi:TolB protein